VHVAIVDTVIVPVKLPKVMVCGAWKSVMDSRIVTMTV